jgi:hypothetical protein
MLPGYRGLWALILWLFGMASYVLRGGRLDGGWAVLGWMIFKAACTTMLLGTINSLKTGETLPWYEVFLSRRFGKLSPVYRSERLWGFRLHVAVRLVLWGFLLWV